MLCELPSLRGKSCMVQRNLCLLKIARRLLESGQRGHPFPRFLQIYRTSCICMLPLIYVDDRLLDRPIVHLPIPPPAPVATSLSSSISAARRMFRFPAFAAIPKLSASTLKVIHIKNHSTTGHSGRKVSGSNEREQTHLRVSANPQSSE